MLSTNLIVHLSVALEGWMEAMQKATFAFVFLHSTMIIYRYPWNPLGLTDYFRFEVKK